MENQKKLNQKLSEMNYEEIVYVNGGSNWPPVGPINWPDIIKDIIDTIRGNDKPEK